MKTKKLTIGGKLRDLTKEYKRDPKGQYFRNLKDMLNIYKVSGVTKKEVVKFVIEWGKQN